MSTKDDRVNPHNILLALMVLFILIMINPLLLIGVVIVAILLFYKQTGKF